jgi:hypothetical protein
MRRAGRVRLWVAAPGLSQQRALQKMLASKFAAAYHKRRAGYFIPIVRHSYDAGAGYVKSVASVIPTRTDRLP